jgi:hypothetical protein
MNFKLIPLLLPFLLVSCKKASDAQNIDNKPPVELSVSPFSKVSDDSDCNALFFYDITNNPLNKKRGWQGCPAIGIENDHYFAAWFANEKDEGDGSYIVVAVSNDKGKTWKSNRLIIAPNANNKKQVDPALWSDRYGILHLSWGTTIGGWDGGAGGVWQVHIKEDNSGGVLITKPTRLFSGIMNVKPTFMGADSSMILFPVSGWNIGKTFGDQVATPTPPEINGALLYTSGYSAANKLMSPVRYAKIPVDNSKRVIDEHMTFPADPDGNSMTAILRTLNSGLTTSYSTDRGRNWTVPAPYKDLGPTTASRSYIGKLKSGKVLIVFNNSESRTNLTACLSNDNGKTWGNKFVIEKTANATYPDVYQNKEGEICLIYDRGGRTAAGEIVFTKFTEQDIINNSPSRLVKTIIDKF